MWKAVIIIKHKEAEILAEDIDFTEMPMIVIKKIKPIRKSNLIALAEDEVYEEIRKFIILKIPYTNVIYCGELYKEEAGVTSIKSLKKGEF